MTSSSPAERLPQSIAGLALRPALWPVVLTATMELGRARRALSRRAARDLVAPAAPVLRAGRADPRLVDRVAWAIPRVAARVPWRADCLVQATAARAWLARHGIATDLHVGARTDRPAGFEAHAWLCHGERIVTGGDVAGFRPLTRTPG